MVAWKNFGFVELIEFNFFSCLQYLKKNLLDVCRATKCLVYLFAQYYDINLDDETKNGLEKCNLKESKRNYIDCLGNKMTE